MSDGDTEKMPLVKWLAGKAPTKVSLFDLVIKRKLVFDGDGTGEEKKVLAFVKLLPQYILNNDPCSSAILYNKLLAQLELIVTGRKKLDLVRKSNSKQMEMFHTLHTTYLEKINLIKDDINKQKNLLRKAKVVKQNYIEYELLVKTVNKEPSRKELSKQIEYMKQEIKTLEKDKQNLDQKLDSRVKQCYVLSTSANTLKGILKEDDVDLESQMEVTLTHSDSELDMQKLLL